MKLKTQLFASLALAFTLGACQSQGEGKPTTASAPATSTQASSESEHQHEEGEQHDHEGEEHHEHGAEDHHDHDHDHEHGEQIVIKITDDGYVTSHGDHFHNMNGKVPADALIDEKLFLHDDSYQLKQEDIVSEHADGYIVKIKDKFYLYVKEGQKPTHVKKVEG